MKINLDLRISCLLCHLRLVFFVVLCTSLAGCNEKKLPASGPPLTKQITESSSELTQEQIFSESLVKAESGDVQAQFSVGKAYQVGKGTTIDLVKSNEWLHKSAAQGNSDAQHALGYRYSKVGQTIYDIKVDTNKLKESFEWYEKAANQGHLRAQVAIALAYLYGEGVHKDAKKALLIFERLAVSGDSVSQYYLGEILDSGKDLPKNTLKAIEWYKMAAAQGHPAALLELGRIYYFGRGVLKDAGAAASYFEKAALKEHPEAFYPIGYLYANGEGVPKDSVAAAKWLGKAASRDDSRAQSILGALYFEGDGVPKDLVLAYAWMNLAAGNGDEMAIAARRMYEKTLSNSEKAEAQRLTAKWRTANGYQSYERKLERESGTPNHSLNSDSNHGKFSKTGTGTGFFVNVSGLLVTNHHVIQGCHEVRLSGQEGVATLVTSDVVNDLALLKLSNAVKYSAVISSEPSKVSQGEDVVVFGFPLNSVLSSGGNLTPGVISALTGLGNNTNQIQITAPIQPGSSGSPVINKKGEIIGVVSMKLSDSRMAAATGQVAQNVNFAVSGQTLKSFLDTHKVDYASTGLLTFNKSNIDLADQAKKWTTVVECWK